jgi:hypothetical protein
MLSSIMLAMAMQQQPAFRQVTPYGPLAAAPQREGVALNQPVIQQYSASQVQAPSNTQLLAGYRAYQADAVTAHVAHVRHVEHLAHLTWLAQQATAAKAAAAYAAQHPVVKAPQSDPAPAATGSYGHPYYCGDGDGDGWDVPCSELHRGSSAPAPAPSGGYQAVTVSAGIVSTAGDGSFQACVISRESGGNSQVMNASSHYGLYQFDYGTWVSGGGNGADFGHASIAEQNRVFANVYAARGTQPWAPSDGC